MLIFYCMIDFTVIFRYDRGQLKDDVYDKYKKDNHRIDGGRSAYGRNHLCDHQP